MPYRLGVIGAGGIGRTHAGAASEAGATVAGFCDIEGDAAAAAAREHSGALATTSLDELLSWPDMEAVVVAVPNHLHKEYAVRALEAGKDVLLEKPMALNTGECDEILAALEKSGRLLQVGFVSRFSGTTLAVRRFVEAGHLGRIYHAEASWIRRRGIPGLGGWFTTRARSGGGVLIDLGVHMIDLVMHLCGRPRPLRVTGSCRSTFGAPIEEYVYNEMWAGPPRPSGSFDVEDSATGLIRFEGGLTLDLTATWAANVPEQGLPTLITLMGEKGGCVFDVWGTSVTLCTEEAGQLVDVKPSLDIASPWAEGWRREHEAFAEVVTKRVPPVATAEHGRAVQTILDALYRSSEADREVEIAP